MVRVETYASLSQSPFLWNGSGGIKGWVSDEISQEQRVNNLSLTWGTGILIIFPRNNSYWNKASRGYKSPSKLYKHHCFKSPVTHFHSHIRTNIQHPVRTDRAEAEGLYPPDLFKHLTCMMPMVNWTRPSWQKLEHHRTDERRKERQMKERKVPCPWGNQSCWTKCLLVCA